MNRVILVGINPSGKPFRKGCSLDKMNAWMEALGFHHYSFSNVIPYEGEYKMRDVDADFVRSFTDGYNKVIALGGFASRALSRARVPHHVLPHPSPLNRKLNDKQYEKECIDKCKEYLNER